LVFRMEQFDVFADVYFVRKCFTTVRYRAKVPDLFVVP
jgi:hypothetical protein